MIQEQFANRLLIFANDPAGANVTMAYAKLYCSSYNEIQAFPTKTSLTIYKEHIPSYITSLNNLIFNKNDTIVTGTSGINIDYEMDIIKQAKQYGVKKIITIVDSTSNFLSRFQLDNEIIKEQYLPDEIWVFQKNFLSNIKHLDTKIIYKEDIYLSYLKEHYLQYPPKIINKSIEQYKNKYIVILSEYIYELYGLKTGYIEYEMVEQIFQELNNLQLNNLPILLKLHPKEHKNKFNILLRKYSNLNIVKIECNIQELIFYSKAVFGINSSVFQESVLFSKDTYSMQIRQNKQVAINVSLKEVQIIHTLKQLRLTLNNL